MFEIERVIVRGWRIIKTISLTIDSRTLLLYEMKYKIKLYSVIFYVDHSAKFF